MPATSEARIEANRRNSLKSTGPRTAEGKARSRANGFKHGLTGSGVVLAEADASEVDARAGALAAELDPRSTVGLALVGQLATLSVRMERGARHEERALASRVRHAAEAFDHDRVDRAEALFEAIADDPRRHLRLLRRSPEGVDRLVEAWGELRDALTRSARPLWTDSDREMAAHLAGRRLEQDRGSRVDSLGRAVLGEPVAFDDPEWAGLDPEARRVWARDRLVERIDEAIAGLEEHRETLDLEAIELDRAGAADVALFDPSREAALARRYDAEARRGFFKALKELRQAEAEAEVQAATRPAPPTARRPEPRPASAGAPSPLASSWDGPAPTPREPEPAPIAAPGWSSGPGDGAARGLDGRVIAVGRAVVVPR